MDFRVENETADQVAETNQLTNDHLVDVVESIHDAEKVDVDPEDYQDAQ